MSTAAFTVLQPAAGGPPFAQALPWSRAAALDLWVRATTMTALVSVAAVATGAAFQERSTVLGDGQVDPTVHAVLSGLLLPLVLVGLARRAERRLLHRPPKRLLSWQFVVFVLGTIVSTASTLRLQNGSPVSPALIAFGHGVLFVSIAILAVWFLGIAIVSASQADT